MAEATPLADVDIEDWQTRLDGWFPSGVIVIRNTGDPDNDPVYRCPQITVLDMEGSMPRIYFAPGDWSGKSFMLRLVSWRHIQDDPIVFAAADEIGQLWRFSNGLSEDLAAQLEALRGSPYQSRYFLLPQL
jgi:hypothetical protein